MSICVTVNNTHMKTKQKWKLRYTTLLMGSTGGSRIKTVFNS